LLFAIKSAFAFLCDIGETLFFVEAAVCFFGESYSAIARITLVPNVEEKPFKTYS
jgi:hypothetical protein